MAAQLILVTGMPGTGKSTLAQKLTQDLTMPLVMKDELKEFLYDKLQTSGLAASQAIGRVVFAAIFELIDQYLELGHNLIVECPFYTSFAAPRVKASLERHGGNLLELHCSLPENTRRERIAERLSSGNRHPQHIAGDMPEQGSETLLPETYAPLSVGKLIKVQTLQFGDKEYTALLTKIKEELMHGAKSY